MRLAKHSSFAKAGHGYSALVRSPIPVVVTTVVSLLVVACGIPHDMENTTDATLQRGSIRAAFIADGDSEAPHGVGPEFVEGFADELGVSTDWQVLSEPAAMEALQDGDLDIVAGGITRTNAWSRHVALSAPVRGEGAEAEMIAVRKGENRWLLRLDRYIQMRRRA